MKSRLRVAVVVIAATLLVGAIAVFATTGRSGTTVTGAGPTPGSYTIKVTLNTRQTVPRARGTIRATGSFTGTLKVVSASKSTLTYGLTFARLTGPALAAHVHLGAAGKAGKIVVPLCAPCRSGAHATKAVSAVAAQAMIAGKAYVNVHTKKNPAGEIRGQVKATSAGGGGASANPYAERRCCVDAGARRPGQDALEQLQLRGLPHARRHEVRRARPGRVLPGRTVHLTNGKTEKATDGYLIWAIEQPDAEIVAGYSSGIMTTAIGNISLAQAKALVAYIKSVK